MKINDIIRELENLAPPVLQESYDNAGLIFGDREQEIEAVLIALDLTDEVISEAVSRNCGMIITHHPLIFKPIKRLSDKHFTNRLLIRAIRENIAIYAAHTNLDSVKSGVSAALAAQLQLKNCRILSPRKDLLKKLVTFCPADHAEKVRSALFEAGAGQIGAYDSCSFNSKGEGTFRASEGTNPFVGTIGELHTEAEIRIETIYPVYLERKLLQALRAAHPYEEIAYDVYALDNTFDAVGFGMIGELESPMNTAGFLAYLRERTGSEGIRYSPPVTDEIRKVALCGGSGSFLIREAIAAGADAFVTGDLKYHDFFEADNQIVLFDIGHYESEQYACMLISVLLTEKFPNFANFISGKNTNPVNYYF